jgi:delta 1-pyrroline-5-carboxylate dehydrogenase
LLQKAEAAKQEKSRAAVVAINAEIRRAKAKLIEEDMPKLMRLAVKKVCSSLTLPPALDLLVLSP